MKKRLFAILLALTLALSLLPTAVFATEGEDTAAGSPALAVQSDNTGIAAQAAHTHCYCGGSVTAGDHTNHEDVTYTACTKANYLRQIFYIEKVDVAYAYLENDMTLDYYFSIIDGKTLYLCLNGHTLNLGEYNIKVSNGSAKLYLCDCSAQKTGTVSGGSSYCVSVNDGVNYNATFNMYGGTLKGGNTTNGGGVNVNNAAFNMYGGTITENTATSDGGGIYVGSKGTLNLYGGTIRGNKVETNESHHGGGVYVESNKWSGVGKISISGSPVIAGNTRTYTDATTGASTTTTENLYLSYGFTNSGDLPIITLGTLTSGANIGIWAGESVFSTASETDYSGYFSSDVAGYHVAYNRDKKLELKAGAAHVHSGGTATCTKKAICSTCGNEYGNIDPAKHVGDTELKGTKAATCTEKGYTGDTYCKGCNAKLADGTDIPAAGHDWAAATCTTPKTCKVCKVTEGDVTGHTGGTANCHAKAVCEVCKEAYGTVDTTKHDGGTEIKNAKAATCTEKGYTGDTYCKGCNTMIKAGAEINALDHDWGKWASNKDGTHTRVCSRDKSHTESGKCSGGKADCCHKAECTVCGGKYGNLDPDNHSDLKHFPAKRATTRAEGNIEYWYCSGCGKYYRDEAATKEITQKDTVIRKRRPSGDSTTTDDKTVKSVKTGDAGIALYVGMAALSLTGGAWLRRKKQ